MRGLDIRKALAAFLVAASLAQPAAAQLAGRSAQEWIQTLDSPTRVAGLKIQETIAALEIKPGQIVADIGAGSGVFSMPLGLAVKPGGKVYAVDIDQGLIDHINEKATETGATNYVEGILGQYTDPALPVQIDLAFINDVLHHIEDRPTYLKNLAGYLKPGGRIAIIEFKPAQGGHRNQPDLQVTQEQATKWLADVGLKPVEENTTLFTDKWFVIFARQQ